MIFSLSLFDSLSHLYFLSVTLFLSVTNNLFLLCHFFLLCYSMLFPPPIYSSFPFFIYITLLISSRFSQKPWGLMGNPSLANPRALQSQVMTWWTEKRNSVNLIIMKKRLATLSISIFLRLCSKCSDIPKIFCRPIFKVCFSFTLPSLFFFSLLLTIKNDNIHMKCTRFSYLVFPSLVLLFPSFPLLSSLAFFFHSCSLIPFIDIYFLSLSFFPSFPPLESSSNGQYYFELNFCPPSPPPISSNCFHFISYLLFSFLSFSHYPF